MGVISFPSWPIFSHVDENGENTIRKWLDQNGTSDAMRTMFQAWFKLIEYQEPSVVPGVIVKVSSDLEAFKGVRKGEPPVYLIFAREVRGSRNITLLAATQKPKDSIGEARRNLAAIERDPRRRRHEPITRRIARRVQ